MIDAATRSERLAALRGEMSAVGAELAAIAPTDHLRWLLGFSPLADERACLLLVTPARAALLVPELNAEQVAAAVPELELVRFADEAGPVAALASTVGRVGGAHARHALVDPEMRADHLMLLQTALPEARTLPATRAMGALRQVKDADELATLARGAAVADDAVRAAWGACAPGMTERAVADAVAAAFSAGGAEVRFAIVGAGPNGAFPHHATGARELRAGEPVLIDVGGELDGYQSDITRMAFLGEPTARYREIHAIVDAACAAGIAAARPGVSSADVDAAARAVIDDAGYGSRFTHRLGHGLGLSEHEPPWIMAGEDAALRTGMVHSVEPGIYLPGEFGVRLEDIVRVTPAGGERLSGLDRAVHVVAI